MRSIEKTIFQPLYRRIPLQRRLILKRASVPALGLAVLTEIFASVLLSSLSKNTQVDPNVSHTIVVLWSASVLTTIVAKILWEYLYLLMYRYDIDANNIVIRRGIITKHEVTLPFAKITDVVVDRDILDVMYGLWDLHISTPTAISGQAAHIDGLSREGCRVIRQLILDRINQAEPRTSGPDRARSADTDSQNGAIGELPLGENALLAY